MNSLPMYPAILTDIVGSAIIIVLSCIALRYAYLLTRRNPENFLWGFLFYISMTLFAFAMSRAVGHILKQVLLLQGNRELWKTVSPYSGGVNTLLMCSLAAVIIFYHKGVEGFQAISKKARSLKRAYKRLAVVADETRDMNLRLEEMVEERTQELAQSEQKFRHFFSNSMDMVYFSDKDRHLVDINEAGLAMLGYSVEDAPLLTLDDIFHSDDKLNEYVESIFNKGFIQDFEVEFEKKDGSIVYVLLSASANRDEDGEFVGCEGLVKDMTRIKTMTTQLISSEKMASVGQMAAGVAHEINTPLGIVLGYSQLMMDDFEEDDDTYQSLLVIERQSKACRKIVADLLKFSRQSESVKEAISVNELLTDVAAVTEHNLNLDHIDIHMDLEDKLPALTGDAEKLRQVVVNLVNNAHHAMEEQGQGELFFSSHYDSTTQEIVTEIRDTGHGIPDHVKDKIFDPFFTTKSVGKGTGLGMSVSYGIVKDHGGRIEMDTKVAGAPGIGENHGTTFRIFLPVPKEELESIT